MRERNCRMKSVCAAVKRLARRRRVPLRPFPTQKRMLTTLSFSTFSVENCVRNSAQDGRPGTKTREISSIFTSVDPCAAAEMPGIPSIISISSF